MITDGALRQAGVLFDSGTDIGQIVNYLKSNGATADEIAQRWTQYKDQAYATDWSTAGTEQIRDGISRLKSEGYDKAGIVDLAAQYNVPLENMQKLYSNDTLSRSYDINAGAPIVQQPPPQPTPNTAPTPEVPPVNPPQAESNNGVTGGLTGNPMAIDYQRNATEEAKGMLGAVRDYSLNATDPYITAGTRAFSNMEGLAGQKYGQENLQNLENLNPNISVNYNDILNDPMYQFAKNEGSELLNRNLASQGMIGSRYGADAQADLGMRTALNERDRIYGQNVDNYGREANQQSNLYGLKNQEGTTAFNANASLAGLGQNTAVNMTNAATNWGNSWVDLTTGLADAEASNALSKYSIGATQDANNDAMWANLAGTALSSDLGQAGLSKLGTTIGSWFK